MKKKNVNTFYINLCENTYEELVLVESVISSIYESCLNQELNSQYYSNENFTLKLSEERNKYINLSVIALERIKNIQSLNGELEKILT